eukprot:5784672-Alexandrium_andersonii.AAC.1
MRHVWVSPIEWATVSAAAASQTVYAAAHEHRRSATERRNVVKTLPRQRRHISKATDCPPPAGRHVQPWRRT